MEVKPYRWGDEGREWMKRDGGLTLRVWQSDFDVRRSNFQPVVEIGRHLELSNNPDLPSLKSAQRAAEKMAATIRREVAKSRGA